MFASLHTSHAAISGIRNGRRAGVARRIYLALVVWRQRQTLACLDDRALMDIGLTRSEALAEARRPIWDVPSHWLR